MGFIISAGPPARDAEGGAKRALLIVAAGALCLGAVFLAAILVLASCSASVASAIRQDGGARVSIEAEMPPTVAAKLRKLAGAGGSQQAAAPASIFDAVAIRKALAERPGVEVLEIAQPNPDSIRMALSIRSIKELSDSPELKGSGIIGIERGPSSTEFRLRLERGKAKAFSALLPGLDPSLTEALSPPALEEDPLSLSEYKTMLKSVLGEKAMPAMEAAELRLSITAPNAVIASEGGTLDGATLKASIPLLELLALEKPIDIRLRWKN